MKLTYKLTLILITYIVGCHDTKNANTETSDPRAGDMVDTTTQTDGTKVVEQWIVFSAQEGGKLGLYAMRADSQDAKPKKLTEISTGGAAEESLWSLSPDGKHIALRRPTEIADIFQLDVAQIDPSSGIVQSQTVSNVKGHFSAINFWSKDSTKLAFAASVANGLTVSVNKEGLYAIEVNPEVAALTLTASSVHTPGNNEDISGYSNIHWSADSKLLAYGVQGTLNATYTNRAAGGTPTKLTDGINNLIEWSPTKNHIAYEYNATLRVDVIGDNGERGELLFQDTSALAASPTHATWSPDGRMLAFSARAPQYKGIYVATMGTNASNTATQRYEANGETDSDKFTWAPNAKNLAYVHSGGQAIANIAAKYTQVWAGQLAGPNAPVWSPNSLILAGHVRTLCSLGAGNAACTGTTRGQYGIAQALVADSGELEPATSQNSEWLDKADGPATDVGYRWAHAGAQLLVLRDRIIPVASPLVPSGTPFERGIYTIAPSSSTSTVRELTKPEQRNTTVFLFDGVSPWSFDDQVVAVLANAKQLWIAQAAQAGSFRDVTPANTTVKTIGWQARSCTDDAASRLSCASARVLELIGDLGASTTSGLARVPTTDNQDWYTVKQTAALCDCNSLELNFTSNDDEAFVFDVYDGCAPDPLICVAGARSGQSATNLTSAINSDIATVSTECVLPKLPAGRAYSVKVHRKSNRSCGTYELRAKRIEG